MTSISVFRTGDKAGQKKMNYPEVTPEPDLDALVILGITTPNGKNRTPSSKFRGAISNGFSGCPANEAEEKKCIRLTSCRQKGALMNFYDVALAQASTTRSYRRIFSVWCREANKPIRARLLARPVNLRRPLSAWGSAKRNNAVARILSGSPDSLACTV